IDRCHAPWGPSSLALPDRRHENIFQARSDRMRFLDREDAGLQLAVQLSEYAKERPLVYALPRGGVPVGYQIARFLEAPLDIVLVEEIGALQNPAVGIGAVAYDGYDGTTVVNRASTILLGIPDAFVEMLGKAMLPEMEQRE